MTPTERRADGQDTPEESPVQAHYRHGGGGAIWTYDYPITDEIIQQQIDNGELQRVNPDGTPYTGRKR